MKCIESIESISDDGSTPIMCDLGETCFHGHPISCRRFPLDRIQGRSHPGWHPALPPIPRLGVCMWSNYGYKPAQQRHIWVGHMLFGDPEAQDSWYSSGWERIAPSQWPVEGWGLRVKPSSWSALAPSPISRPLTWGNTFPSTWVPRVLGLRISKQHMTSPYMSLLGWFIAIVWSHTYSQPGYGR